MEKKSGEEHSAKAVRGRCPAHYHSQKLPIPPTGARGHCVHFLSHLIVSRENHRRYSEKKKSQMRTGETDVCGVTKMKSRQGGGKEYSDALSIDIMQRHVTQFRSWGKEEYKDSKVVHNRAPPGGGGRHNSERQRRNTTQWIGERDVASFAFHSLKIPPLRGTLCIPQDKPSYYYTLETVARIPQTRIILHGMLNTWVSHRWSAGVLAGC